MNWYQVYLGGGFKYFYFHPYLGKIPILTNIFQLGWNHQLVTLWLGGFGRIFIFTPIPGRFSIQFDEHMFLELGWFNLHLDDYTELESPKYDN